MFANCTHVRHVVLHGTAETLIDRIRLRRRGCEKNIALNDLQKLQRQHDSWLQSINPMTYRTVSHDDGLTTVSRNVCAEIAHFVTEHLQTSCSDSEKNALIEMQSVLNNQ